MRYTTKLYSVQKNFKAVVSSTHLNITEILGLADLQLILLPEKGYLYLTQLPEVASRQDWTNLTTTHYYITKCWINMSHISGRGVGIVYIYIPGRSSPPAECGIVEYLDCKQDSAWKCNKAGSTVRIRSLLNHHLGRSTCLQKMVKACKVRS